MEIVTFEVVIGIFEKFCIAVELQPFEFGRYLDVGIDHITSKLEVLQ